jgi:uncharacterized membrane protein HdeD (DUF308 family)
MYAALSVLLLIAGLVTALCGLVEREHVIAVLGYLAALAGIAGIADVSCRKREQRY